MDQPTVDLVIPVFLREIRQRLEEAAGGAKTAEACALAGDPGRGVSVSLDIEQLIYEANHLLNAASLISRLVREV
jgi:hypothetical protein